jgi:hypothetical protein
MKTYSFENGKYVVEDHDDGSVLAKRYGEPWKDFTGDKLFYLMLARIEELEQELARFWMGSDDYKRKYDPALDDR